MKEGGGGQEEISGKGLEGIYQKYKVIQRAEREEFWKTLEKIRKKLHFPRKNSR